jgi:lipoate---protein ligase
MPAFRLLDLTLPSPVENLALDEALSDELEEQGGDPILRLWESRCHFVVLGRSCRRADDVYLDACEEDGVPILRRASGGGTVLQGPGCLSYALILPLALSPQLSTIRGTYRFILERLASALRRWEPATAFRGVSDLAIEDMKISGNAQRRRRRTILFHGTILYGLSVDRIARYLTQPRRQPEYRAGRPHGSFLRTIAVPAQDLKDGIAAAWNAKSENAWPVARMPHAVAAVVSRTAEDSAAYPSSPAPPGAVPTVPTREGRR